MSDKTPAKEPQRLAENGHLISIVGAGPGDPELLTVRALRRLQQADVILYDALHGDEILQVANPNAQRIYAGKKYKDGQQQTERGSGCHRVTGRRSGFGHERRRR